MRIFVVSAVVLAMVAAACGGGGDSDNPNGGEDRRSPAADATPDNFDPNIMSAMVLAPEDLDEPLPGRATFNPDPTNGVTFLTEYGDGESFLLQSSVGRLPDPVLRDLNLSRARRGMATYVGPESNYDIEGSDRAYYYYSESLRSQGTLIFLGDYFVQIIISSPNGNLAEVALDRDRLDLYADVVFGRLQQYLEDPDSLTPIPDAPKFATPNPTEFAELTPDDPVEGEE